MSVSKSGNCCVWKRLTAVSSGACSVCGLRVGGPRAPLVSTRQFPACTPCVGFVRFWYFFVLEPLQMEVSGNGLPAAFRVTRASCRLAGLAGSRTCSRGLPHGRPCCLQTRAGTLPGPPSDHRPALPFLALPHGAAGWRWQGFALFCVGKGQLRPSLCPAMPVGGLRTRSVGVRGPRPLLVH